MTALASFTATPAEGWTDHALEQLPEGAHYEIEDGHLVVSPRPSIWHQEVASRLKFVLEQQCPPGLWPVQEAEIRVYAGNVVAQMRSPDTLVVPSALVAPDAERGWAHPHEVALVAEVVSPGSQIADRATKVAVYADWGIPLYLRLEIDGPEPVLHAHHLGADGRYGPATEHRGAFETDTPFPLRIDLANWNTPSR